MVFVSVTRNLALLHTPFDWTRTSYLPFVKTGAGPASPKPGGTWPYLSLTGSGSSGVSLRRAIDQIADRDWPRYRTSVLAIWITATGADALPERPGVSSKLNSEAGTPRDTSTRTSGLLVQDNATRVTNQSFFIELHVLSNAQAKLRGSAAEKPYARQHRASFSAR
jgi:hypothetical protein